MDLFKPSSHDGMDMIVSNGDGGRCGLSGGTCWDCVKECMKCLDVSQDDTQFSRSKWRFKGSKLTQIHPGNCLLCVCLYMCICVVIPLV